MIVTNEAWSVIGTGVAILVAIATSHRQLCGEVKALRDELRAEMKAGYDELRGNMRADRSALDSKIDDIRTELGGLRERMAMLEGLLVGLREAITGSKVA